MCTVLWMLVGDRYEGHQFKIGAVSASTRMESDGRMYAVSSDLQQDCLARYYSGSDVTNAYGDIRRVMERRGFWNQQGSLYFSDDKDPVVIWQAIMELKEKYDWFAKCVKDLRMLRIDENSNLMPLLGQPELPLGDPTPKRKPDSPLKLN